MQFCNESTLNFSNMENDEFVPIRLYSVGSKCLKIVIE